MNAPPTKAVVPDQASRGHQGAGSLLPHQPNESAARFRFLLPTAWREHEADPSNRVAISNLNEALMKAARCGKCAFYERGECHVAPPLPSPSDGNASWPKVKHDQWCGAWRPL